MADAAVLDAPTLTVLADAGPALVGQLADLADMVAVLAAEQSLTGWLETKLQEIRSLTVLALTVGAMLLIGWVFVRSKGGFVPVISLALVAALTLWAVNNLDWLKDLVEGETSGAASQQQPTNPQSLGPPTSVEDLL